MDVFYKPILVDHFYWLVTVCFNKEYVEVEEGQRVELELSASKRLSSSVRVQFVYTDGNGISALPAGGFHVVIMLKCVNIHTV